MRYGLVAAVSALALITVGCGSRTAGVATTATPSHRLLFADLVAKVRTGIVRIETEGCDGGAIGTGFLLTPSLVATVEHVVDGAQTINLKQNGHVVGLGTVIGSDPTRDLALVRSSKPIPGYMFKFASRAPRLGEDVAAVGFPLGLPLTVTRGSVSGSDRTIPIDGVNRHSLVQTDAAVNPGNSGGPLMTDSGQVVGLVDLGTDQANGLAFAVNAAVAGPLFAAWRGAPQPISTPGCVSRPPTQQAAPPPPTSTTGTAVQTYRGQDFSISYPSSFVVTSAEVNKGSYYDTTIQRNNFLLRVDENPSAGSESVATAAAPVLKALRGESGYREIALDQTAFEGWDALRWEFEVPERGVLLHKVDLFFIDNNGSEWAILTQAPSSVYRRVADAFEAMRQSFSEPGG